ncbi:hypothetical protein UNH65_17250 [Chitinophaga sp. 180180018-2]|nr:hypothetical protein [Chitinophaga sp. 212800010-3]
MPSPKIYASNNNCITVVIPDTVHTTGNTLITLKALIKNTCSHTKTFKITTVADSVLTLVGQSRKLYTLSGGDSMYLLFYIAASKKSLAGVPYSIHVNVQSPEDSLLGAAECLLWVERTKAAYLTLGQSELVLTEKDDSIRYQVRVTNKGNARQVIRLLAKYPDYLQMPPSYMQISLGAWRDTTLNFVRHIKHTKRDAVGYIQVTGYYDNGDYFASTSLVVYNASSKVSFLHGTEGKKDNEFMLSVNNIGSSQPFYSLLSTGNFLTYKHTHLRYQLDAHYFPGNTEDKLLLRNSFFSLRRRNTVMTIGRISRFFDLDVQGAGLLVERHFAANAMEVGFTRAVYNAARLFTICSAAGYSSNLWVGYKSKKGTLQAIYQVGEQERLSSFIASCSRMFYTHPHHSLSGSLSLSMEAGQRRKNWGLASSILYKGILGKWEITMDNSFSSPSYAGFQKGALLMEDRVQYSLSSRQLLWMRYSKTAINSPSVHFIFGSRKIELGWSSALGKSFNVTLSPSLYAEHNTMFAQQQLTDIRMLWQLSYRHPAGRFLLFSQTETSLGEKAVGIRHIFTLNYWRLYFSTTMQKGAFSLYERSYARQAGVTDFSSSIIALQLIQPIAALGTEASLGYQWMQQTSHWVGYHNISMQLTTNLNAISSCFASGNYQIARGTGSNYLNLQLGLRLKFASPAIKHGGKRLKVQVYKDINNNSRFDAPDSIAGGVLLHIGDRCLITDKNGKAVYRHLPSGEYNVISSGIDNWTSSPVNFQLHGDSLLRIGLRQVAIISGRLTVAYDAYSKDDRLALETVLVAVSGSQGERYTAPCDARGRFKLFVPAGDYNVSIGKINSETGYVVTNNNQLLHADVAVANDVEFKILVQKKTVEVRRF